MKCQSPFSEKKKKKKKKKKKESNIINLSSDEYAQKVVLVKVTGSAYTWEIFHNLYKKQHISAQNIECGYSLEPPV